VHRVLDLGPGGRGGQECDQECGGFHILFWAKVQRTTVADKGMDEKAEIIRERTFSLILFSAIARKSTGLWCLFFLIDPNNICKFV